MRSLQGKLVAFVVGLIAVSVLVLGGLFYQQLRGQLLNAVTAGTRSAATGYAHAIIEQAQQSTMASLVPLGDRIARARQEAEQARAALLECWS